MVFVSFRIYFLFLFFGSSGSSSLRMGFLALQRAGVPLCCGAWVSRCSGFSLRGAQAVGCVASELVALRLCRQQTQQLWCTGSIAPRHVGSSRNGDQTALQGRFLTTGLLGKPSLVFLKRAHIAIYVFPVSLVAD